MITRKNFLIGAAATAATASAIDCECIGGWSGRARGLTGGAFMGTMLAQQGGGTPTAKSYLQDGLAIQFDGIENAGYGVHGAAATIWTDLIDGVNATPNVNNPSWSDDASVYGTDYRSMRFSASSATALTIEIVASHQAESGNSWLISGRTSSRRGIEVSKKASTGGINFTFNGSNNFTSAKLAGYLPSVADTARHVLAMCADYSSTMNTSHIQFFVDGSQTSEMLTGENQYDTRNVLSTFEGLEIGGGTSWNATTFAKHAEICALRIYHRMLTAAEIAANFAVDAARFGLT